MMTVLYIIFIFLCSPISVIYCASLYDILELGKIDEYSPFLADLCKLTLCFVGSACTFIIMPAMIITAFVIITAATGIETIIDSIACHM